MLPTDVRIGCVFRYSYLWHRQHIEGREEGDKDRPCLVLAIVTTEEDGSPIVRVLPITHSPQAGPDDAIEIPRPVKLRLRFDDERSWIVLNESNRFVWPGRARTCGLSTAIAATTGPSRRRCLMRSNVASSRSPAARRTSASHEANDACRSLRGEGARSRLRACRL